jgi:hypothetical protein
MKFCRQCESEKPLDEFYADNRTKDGKCYTCKPCHEKRYKTWKRANKQKVSGYNSKWWATSEARFKRYGLTKEDYENMLKEQNNRCAICKQFETVVIRGKLRPLHIDHDAETKIVRGLLCSACNTGIGKLKHNISIIESAADYLRKEENGNKDL